MDSAAARAIRWHDQGRHALAIGILAGALFAASSAGAESAVEIAKRIESTFALLLTSPAEPVEPLARLALARRAVERNGAVAALPYREVEPVPAAFLPGVPEGPATGLFAQSLSADVIVVARLPRPRPQEPLRQAPIITGSVAPTGQALPDASLLEAEYFGRFAGSFTGSGEVKRNARANANHVRCNLTGQPLADGVSISGACGAAIFSREVRADIRFDPASGVYTGTYIGSNAGPAKLWGRRRGDQVVLTITWPKPVNGDTKATMTIHNPGNGSLAITVVDAVHPGGPQAEVTRLALSQF
jgi:hypothetical protein